ncbi:MAG TPA: hypothetical protein VIK39_10005 [Candidatus Angelobacter sp.]
MSRARRSAYFFGQESQSTTEQYRELFDKHLSRYLLGPHLTGALAFAKACENSHLQAVKLLGEAVLLVETQRLSLQKVQKEVTSFAVPAVLHQMIEQIHHRQI